MIFAAKKRTRKTPNGIVAQVEPRVFLCGLATDFCVHYSALDARAEGFETAVIIDACRAIDLDGSLGAAMAAMDDAGVAFTSSEKILAS